MNFYDTCQLDLINIEPEKQIELIPVDHKRNRRDRYNNQRGSHPLNLDYVQ